MKRADEHGHRLLGFAPAALEVDGPVLDRTRVPFGGSVRFTATIRNTGAEDARLAIDYVVHHHRADGSRSTRAFKLMTRTLAPDETIRVAREHSFRLLTTRRHHPGPHAIALQISGVTSDRAEFEPQAP